MRPGTRACYGAAAVGIFAGLLMAAAGAIILLETAYVDGEVSHAVWMLACFMCVAGFIILLVALLCCSCALCLHASSDASVHPEEEDEELEGKKSAGWATPVTNGGIHQVWTPPSHDVPTDRWVLTSSPGGQEVEDLEELAIIDTAEEEEEQAEVEEEEEEAALEAELAAVEAEEEAEPEPEPEPQPDVEPEKEQEEAEEEQEQEGEGEVEAEGEVEGEEEEKQENR